MAALVSWITANRVDATQNSVNLISWHGFDEPT
jgi:hypothetical protein